MAYTDEQYKGAAEFIAANLGNPSYIAQVAADLGISLEDITKAVQTVDPNATVAQVENYFDSNLVDFDRPYEGGIYSFETKEDRDAYLSSGDPNLKYYNAALTGQPIDTSSDTTATQPATTTQPVTTTKADTTTKATTTATQPATTTKATTTATQPATTTPFSIKSQADIASLSPDALKAVRDFISGLYAANGIGIDATEAKQIQDRAAALGVDPSMINNLVSTAYKGYGGDTYSTEDISKLIGGLGTTLEGLQQQKIDAAKGYVAPTISGKGVDVSGESGLRSMYGPYVQDILSRASGLLALRDDPNFQEREFGTTYGTSTFKDLEDLQKQRKSMMGMGDDKSSMYTPYKYSFANMPATAEAQGVQFFRDYTGKNPTAEQMAAYDAWNKANPNASFSDIVNTMQPMLAGQQTTKPAAKGGLMSLIDSYADGGTVGQTVPSTFNAPAGYTGNTYDSGYTAPTMYQAPTSGITSSTFDATQAKNYMSPYTSGVVDPQVREAKRQSEIQGMANAAKFTQAGAFGGTRNVLAEAERQRNLSTQVGDIYGKGQQEAFLNAQQQFERDQARNLQAQIATEQARQAQGQQALSSAATAGQLGLDASRLTEQSKQFGAQYGLNVASTAAQYDQAARQLQQQAEEAQARGDQFAANLALQQLQEAQRAAEATRGFEYQQARDTYLDPFRELGYAQQLLGGLPIKAGDTGVSPSLEALVASLGLGSMFKGG